MLGDTDEVATEDCVQLVYSSKAQTIPEEVDGLSEVKMVESIPEKKMAEIVPEKKMAEIVPEKKMAEIVPEKKMAESLPVVELAESVHEKAMDDHVAVTTESDVLHPVGVVKTISTLAGGVDVSDVRREEGVAQPPEEHLQHVLEKILRNLREKRRKVNRPESLAVSGVVESLAVSGVVESLAVSGVVESLVVSGVVESLAVSGVVGSLAVSGVSGVTSSEWCCRVTSSEWCWWVRLVSTQQTDVQITLSCSVFSQHSVLLLLYCAAM